MALAHSKSHFHSLQYLSIITIIILILFIQTSIATSPLYHICSNSQNFTTNSPYERNLNNLLGDLYLKTPPTGFGLSSTAQSYADRAYGMSLCRGDISKSNCTACVVEASSEILKRCPNNRGAIIWYDNCLLKYSDIDFFGEIDTRNRFYMWNLQNVSTNGTHDQAFNQRTRELLSNLSNEACGSTKMFANGEVELISSMKIYGMVQSSRDLSSVDCKRCIDDAISELPVCCEGRQGGRVVGGSCNIRYEIYPFLNL
ncbi:hypothetical protein ACJIZ3_006907 [Penstemon smallii]|uniref:Gnk2-homologous domain-containing protein n=1 Tax=Penstemon smallii TaxID=265156 RepID=A0ABD3S9G8_9LAMI